jgi:hypothetical protein
MGGEQAMPLLLPAVAKAPWATLGGLLYGTGAATGTEHLLRERGVAPGYAALAGDVAGLGAGVVGGFTGHQLGRPGTMGELLRSEVGEMKLPREGTRTLKELTTEVPKSPSQQSELPPLWEMSYDELGAIEQQIRRQDKDDLVALFGEEGSKRYRQLERLENSWDSQKATKASAEKESMEASLTEAQRNQLFGIDQPELPTVDEVRDYQQAVGSLDWSSPEDLGRSLRWAMTKVGSNPDPARMNHTQRVAYAQIRTAMQQAAKEGWDPARISGAALEGAAGRFEDPEDAAYMLQHFIDAARPRPSEAPPSGQRLLGGG